MNKELECLKRIDMKIYTTEREHRIFYSVVEQALKRLEAIDNANPSEALECLEEIGKTEVLFRNRDTIYMGGEKPSFNHKNTIGNELKGAFDTIKQALLKAQEPKQYLKWEDLEFKEEEQIMKVRLNGTEYDMKYFDKGDFEFIMLQNDKYNAVAFSDYCNKQFFNDLRLERVEE